MDQFMKEINKSMKKMTKLMKGLNISFRILFYHKKHSGESTDLYTGMFSILW